MRKIYLSMIVAVAVTIAFTVVTLLITQSPPEPKTIFVSVSKISVNYNDTENWSVKGLPPNAEYDATAWWPGDVLKLGSGTADANGEATGSFLVVRNIPVSFTLRISLPSDPARFGEAAINLKIPADEPYDLDIRAEIVIKDLGQCGTSFVFVPDGRIFCVGVKTGKVGVIENFQLLPEPMLELDVYTVLWGTGGFNDERGLTGITIDPEFEKNHYVYLHWSYLDSEDDKSYNRVARFTESNNKLTNMTIILDKIPAGTFHNGGPLEFGYDGKLYITTGDGHDVGQRAPKRSQNMSSLAGKILRINSDGTIPEDNPSPGLPYYTLGHRNVFGIGFHPVTKIPYITEHGPACCDEVNILIPGGNYGHPYVLGKDNYDKDIPEELVGKQFVEPLMEFTPNIAPTELIFYTGDKYPGEVNKMFFLSFNYRELYNVVLKPPNYDEVLSISKYPIGLEGKNVKLLRPWTHDLPGGALFNSLLDIEQGPDEYLYISSFESIMRLDFVYTDIPTTISLDAKSDARTQESIKLRSKILDYFGNPVADVPVNFFDSDKLIGSAISNQEGIADLEYTLEGADQHIITAKFAGGEKYRPSSSPEWLMHVSE